MLVYFYHNYKTIKSFVKQTNMINSLTAKSCYGGNINSRPVGFYSRNSTESTVNSLTA